MAKPVTLFTQFFLVGFLVVLSTVLLAGETMREYVRTAVLALLP